MKSLTLPLPLSPSTTPRSDPRPALLPVPTPAAPPPAQLKRTRRAIWLALHFPDWPLRAALSALSDVERSALEVQPLAVVDTDRRSTVLACNEAASSFGIRMGHSINAAIALCADTQFLPRNPVREVELLRDVAGLCEHYTSAVSLQPPNELVLEVRGSVRLFGGIGALVDRIRIDLKPRGFDPRIAMSSTVHSSLWLSRAAEIPTIVQPRDLIRSLSRLPVSVLLWPDDVRLRLARFGVLTIGDLLRLPRGGLARRIGHERLEELDRAVGRHPDVRRYFIAADHYEDHAPLDFEIETTGLLSVILGARLRRLQAFLTRRNLAVDAVRIQLKHREQAVTPMLLGLASPTADMDHVSQLMREQLSRVQLPSPVVALTIIIERLITAPEVTRELFASASSPGSGDARTQAQARLLEQLRSRLGDSTLTRLHTEADHRPECAHTASSATVQPKKVGEQLPIFLAPRPLWLLSKPCGLQLATLRAEMAGPERIESGWWDGQFAVRDYYRLTSSRGALGWAYRDRLESSQWRLHGLFG